MSQNKNRNALLGKKLGMSQVWDENGFFVPVTLVEVSTNVVTAVKNEETDGYKAVQLGYGQVDPRKVTKPMAGHFAKAGVTPRRHLAEVRTENVEDFEPGQELTAEVFPEGVQVDVTGTTKGKGFAGTIKRWGFKSYRRTHGSHKNERRPGSVGACATPSRILRASAWPVVWAMSPIPCRTSLSSPPMWRTASSPSRAPSRARRAASSSFVLQ